MSETLPELVTQPGLAWLLCGPFLILQLQRELNVSESIKCIRHVNYDIPKSRHAPKCESQ